MVNSRDISVSKTNKGYKATLDVSPNESYVSDSFFTKDEAINHVKKLFFGDIKVKDCQIDSVQLWKQEGMKQVSKISGETSDKMLTTAFYHSMPPGKSLFDHTQSNKDDILREHKRLVTLGNSVVNYHVTQHFYDNDVKSITDQRSKLMNKSNLGTTMIKSGYNKYIITSGESDLSNNVNVQAETLEAWIGALSIYSHDKELNLFMCNMKII